MSKRTRKRDSQEPPAAPPDVAPTSTPADDAASLSARIIAAAVQVRPVPDDEWRERRRVERWPDKWQVLFQGSRLLTRPTIEGAIASGRQCALDRRCALAVFASREVHVWPFTQLPGSAARVGLGPATVAPSGLRS